MKNFIYYTAFLILFICAQNPAVAQDKKDNTLKKSRVELYEKNLLKTKWKPNRGIGLLTTKESKKLWNNYAKMSKSRITEKDTCYVPSLDIKDDKSNITSYFVFSTDNIYIFVYSHQWQRNDNLIWSICTKDYKQITFSELYETGYDFNDPSITKGDSCGGSTTVVQFEELHEDSPLFLGITLSRCQDHDNHHELLFHLDKERLEEVKGSRMDMDYLEHPSQPWRWWHPEEGFSPRDYSLGKERYATWTRKANKRLPGLLLSGHHAQVSILRKCEYSKESRSVTCTERILKPAILEDYDSLAIEYLQTCTLEKLKCEEVLRARVEELTENGFVIDNNVVDKAIKIVASFPESE